MTATICHHLPPLPLRAWQLVLAVCCLLLSGLLHASAPAPRISIILDDLGEHWQSGQRALQLPGAITYAFLPKTTHASTMAQQAHANGKEVMIHMPMQAMSGNKLGPGGLTLDMTRSEFIRTLHNNLASVPHAKGVNNHMGSLLTRHPGHMQWLMDGLRQLNPTLYFIDSRTTHHTVAYQLAEENHIPNLQRDVFLDDDPSLKAIQFQLKRLLKTAQRNGQAIGIGHPYDTTLIALERWLPTLKAHGIELVPVSALFQTAPNTDPVAPRLAETETSPHINLEINPDTNTLVYAEQPNAEPHNSAPTTTVPKTSLNPL